MIRQTLFQVWKSFTHKSFTEIDRNGFELYKRIEHVSDADIWPFKLKSKVKE